MPLPTSYVTGQAGHLTDHTTIAAFFAGTAPISGFPTFSAGVNIVQAGAFANQLFLGNGLGPGSGNQIQMNAPVGAPNYIYFLRNGVNKWLLYDAASDAIYFRDMPNAKMHLALSPGAGAGLGDTTIDSRLQVIGVAAFGGTTIPSVGLTVYPVSTGSRGLVVSGLAGQVGTLQEWQDSAASVFVSIGSGGVLNMNAGATAANIQATRAGFGTASVPGAAVGQVLIQPQAVGNYGLAVMAMAGQTANLQEWQDSAAAIGSTISENGYYTTRKTAAPADAELANGEMAFWFDSTNGAAKFMVKAKSANGTVVTGSLALA